MTDKIRVSILDGYCFRLSGAADIEVVDTLMVGEALEPALALHPVDVLILDVSVPTSPQNANNYPIMYLIPKLIDRYPGLSVLVMSMNSNRVMVHSILGAGASAIIAKRSMNHSRRSWEAINHSFHRASLRCFRIVQPTRT